MCFSAQASFTASAILALSSIFAFKQIANKKQVLLAAIPLLFAFQQATEGLLWLSFRFNNSALQTLTTYVFLFFASMLWPIWAPLTLFILEKNSVRKRLIGITVLIGIATALFVGFHIFYYGAAAHTMMHHITYDFYIPSLLNIPSLVAYLMATALPFFISSIPYFWIGGILIPLAYLLSYIFYIESIGSIWCFSVALLSGLICIMLHVMNKERKKDDSWYWRRFR